MEKTSREKIALIVFAALIVLALGGFMGYLAVGHSWNVAATTIDDAAGSLDGYTAILYEGTQKPTGSTGKSDSSGGENTAAKKNTSGSEKKSDASEISKGVGSSGSTEEDASNDILEVQKNYQSKKAETLILDTTDIDQYYEGMILKKGDRRFGVFSVQETDRLFTILQKVLYFKRYQVDFVVALTPDMDYLEGARGIDIVISTQNENLFAMGETIDGTFYTSAPAIGDVGVVIISPSNVITSKDISFQ